MMKTIKSLVCTAAFFTFFINVAFAQTGKITGTVTDAATGNPLPGVNVVIVGTQQGATTNVEGFYSILNVSPGTYDVRASFVGFAPVTQEGVRVNIDLTTEVDFAMQEETVGLEEVTVQATEPVVKRDISANVANLSAEDIENVPVAGISEVISLQAGVEPGMRVRGGGLNEVNMLVDGMSMRSGRDNVPFTGISYTSIAEVQVQTGGFNAEYGNVRSGLINVVTKEGPRDHYTADVMARYGAPTEKYFGGLPSDNDAYWIRPFVDEDVAFEGTRNGSWDSYDQQQYPDFEGWNAVAENYEGMTPEEVQEVFLFRHRKNFEIDDPDYVFDGSMGGPVPIVSDYLGDLRFFSSYRTTQSPYVVPQRRSSYRDHTVQMKVTSNVASNMKLNLLGMYAKQLGMNSSGEGFPDMFQGNIPPYPWSDRGMVDNLGRDNLFALDVWTPMDVTRSMVGADLTHTLGANTFYEINLQRSHTDYWTRPGPQRSEEVIRTIGGMELDEAPFGWESVGENDVSGLRIGGHWGGSRDSSEVLAWSGEFDLTSQLNQWIQVKTGVDYIYNSYDVTHGRVDSFFVHEPSPKYRWNRQPTQGALYGQGKFEFEGIIANVGLRLDYFHGGGEWYNYDPYPDVFAPTYPIDALDEELETEPIDRQFALSPRLGVAFPITENSKFFFNYGHFRQMLNPQDIFVVQEVHTGQVGRIGNPDHPMPLTVSYEMGYEQNILDQLLLRVTGYYKAQENQPRLIHFEGLNDGVSYNVSRPYNYGDIRGLEVSLSRNRGWIRGFANYTFMVRKSGNFGFGQQFENPVDQRQFEREARNFISAPVPEPYAHVNLEFVSPVGWGPELAGLNPLGDWRVSWLGEWRSGETFTWSGREGNVPGLQNNVRWTDYYNLDLRLAKNINVGDQLGDLNFFIDISNILNLRHLYRYSSLAGPNDWALYMESLHLPEDVFEGRKEYTGVPGSDQPGDYRTPGAPYVPVEVVGTVSEVDAPLSRPLYYERDSGTYMWYRNGEFTVADEDFVDSVLENKQYIDMPNASYFRFLNPRRVEFGIRVSF